MTASPPMAKTLREAHIAELRRLMADTNVVRFTPDADFEIRELLDALAQPEEEPGLTGLLKHVRALAEDCRVIADRLANLDNDR